MLGEYPGMILKVVAADLNQKDKKGRIGVPAFQEEDIPGYK